MQLVLRAPVHPGYPAHGKARTTISSTAIKMLAYLVDGHPLYSRK
jgi:hypothetical protein